MTTTIQQPERCELDHQIARVAWALLFILLGGLGSLRVFRTALG
jgi:hypothetical protein